MLIVSGEVISAAAQYWRRLNVGASVLVLSLLSAAAMVAIDGTAVALMVVYRCIAGGGAAVCWR